jgi:arginine deiminase
MTFNVQSEAGQLRQVIVHRPGLELSRLTHPPRWRAATCTCSATAR